MGGILIRAPLRASVDVTDICAVLIQKKVG